MYRASHPIKRNNTNFPTQLFEHIRNAKFDTKYDFLKYYQNVVRDYVATSLDAKGILCSLEMGLGKSILAVAIAIDQLLEKSNSRQPIVLLTKSLQENMHKSIHKYVRLRAAHDREFPLGHMDDAALNDWIAYNFSFVSMNASNMIEQMNKATEGHATDEIDIVLEKKIGELAKLVTLDNKTLIIDEAHNFFRAITNGSKNAHELYELIMKSDVLLIFLTGTPIANNSFELVPCFNMLAGYELFPSDYHEFVKLYVNNGGTPISGTIKNKNYFQNRILGLVSYVSNKSHPGAAIGITEQNKAKYPEQLDIIVARVHMDSEQYVAYLLARDKEMAEGGRRGKPGKFTAQAPASLTKPKSQQSSTYRVRSRQISNNYVNNHHYSPKFRAMKKIVDERAGQLGLVYSQFIGDGGIGGFANVLNDDGWEKLSIKSIIGNADRVNTIDTIVDNINISGGNWWLDEAEDISSILGAAEVIAVNTSTVRPRKYAVIDGSVPFEERKLIEQIFNRESNKHGGEIDLLLISATGAEGLDLKNGRYILIMDPFWNMGRIYQIIFRFVRNDSHIALSKHEQSVQPYIFLAVPPVSEKQVPTTDTELYEDAMKDAIANDTFIEALHEVSIECAINGEPKCRSCNPDNRQLFSNDPARDIRSIDPCKAISHEMVVAAEISIDGVTYFYAESDSIYDYSVYEYDVTLDGYVPMNENSPKFLAIIEAIKLSKK